MTPAADVPISTISPANSAGANFPASTSAAETVRSGRAAHSAARPAQRHRSAPSAGRSGSRSSRCPVRNCSRRWPRPPGRYRSRRQRPAAAPRRRARDRACRCSSRISGSRRTTWSHSGSWFKNPSPAAAASNIGRFGTARVKLSTWPSGSLPAKAKPAFCAGARVSPRSVRMKPSATGTRPHRRRQNLVGIGQGRQQLFGRRPCRPRY